MKNMSVKMSKVLIVMVADSLPSLRIFCALQPVAQKLSESQRFAGCRPFHGLACGVSICVSSHREIKLRHYRLAIQFDFDPGAHDFGFMLPPVSQAKNALFVQLYAQAIFFSYQSFLLERVCT